MTQQDLNFTPDLNLTPGEMLVWKGYWWRYKGYNKDPLSGNLVIGLEIVKPTKKNNVSKAQD